MRLGQKVSVPVLGGELVSRIVTQVIDNIVVVSTEEEVEAATRESRDPVGVGYHECDVSAA